MEPVEFVILASAISASVASLIWILLRRGRWATDGLGLEMRPPSSIFDSHEFAAALLFFGAPVLAGIFSGRRAAALTFGLQVGGTVVVTTFLAVLRPRMFGPRSLIAPAAVMPDTPAVVPGEGRFDVFISYKSEDVRLAREVADQLIGSGITPWFAEYEIGPDNYERFQDAIDAGLEACEYGLAITNDAYADSAYCRHEITRLLETCGPDRVVEVEFHPGTRSHDIFLSLESVPRREIGSTPEALSFLAQRTGWEIRDMEPPLDGRPREIGGAVTGAEYSLDITGWELVDPRGHRLSDGTIEGPVLRCTTHACLIHANVFIGADQAPKALRHVADGDDRQMYMELIDYLPHHVGRLATDVKGLHLLFHSGLSQMAVTYPMEGYWTRKHSVIVAHPRNGAAVEFVFTFGFMGPFTEYCRHAHLMDALVGTLAWA